MVAEHPGAILTFLPRPDAPKGWRAAGQVTDTPFASPIPIEWQSS
jgi:hypothetical protein